MSICTVFGLGYIGLPTAAVLAENGHQVNGIDIEKNVVDTINKGLIHIVEPKLDKIVEKVISNKKLKAFLEPQPADVFIIAVPTPFHKNNSKIPQPNINYVLDVARSIGTVIKEDNLVILESTSPIGTTEKVINEICSNSNLTKDKFKVAYCPERVLPGNVIYELTQNNRVIGGINTSSSEAAKSLYETFCHGELIFTDCRTAELVKLTENAYRDVNIAFANELSLLCHKRNINVNELINLSNFHPRVNILKPGCGVGGHCIAVDPWFIAADSPEITPLIQTARAVNENKSSWTIDQIKSISTKLNKKLGKQPNIGILGLSFKPDIDDLRESPALNITLNLLESGLNLLVCEPNLTSHPKINLYKPDHVIEKADLVVILVAHSIFKELDLKDKLVFDLTGITNKIYN